MTTQTFERRRGQIELYFDRTASAAWARLTSTEKLGRIRATVRAGRDAMRATMLSWLDTHLVGLRVLDAGLRHRGDDRGARFARRRCDRG